ncbi:MAG: acetyltransferase [Hyphomicrobiales bacterium]|nr:MAG: acetyltransferase [Hyphomicrobiales bacterium]
MSLGVIVLGAGGHAKVCIDLLRAMGREPSFCIGGIEAPLQCLGVPVLQGDSHLQRLAAQGYREAFVAIGDNALRQRLGQQVLSIGLDLVNAISPQAVVAPSTRLGRGIAVMAGAVINADSELGDLAIVNTCASVDHDGRLAPAAHIAPHTGLAGNVTVGERSFLGVGCKVIPGVIIGADVIAGAGSVIIADVPAGNRIAGVPAKPLRKK